MDLTDDSLKGTPNRVAKMFVKEIFGGLNPARKPKASTFENGYKYGEMLVEKNITLYSTCEHHLLPIIGKAHVAYISKGRVIGLSKINRIVEYLCQKTSGSRAFNNANCTRASNCTWNRRCGLHYRCETPMCKF